MRKGTFSVKKAGTNSAAHNSRENAPKYLIGLSPGTQNFYKLFQNDNDFILEAKQLYRNRVGQEMQKAYTISKGKNAGKKVAAQEDNLIQETVLTLQNHQDENDVYSLFEKLKKKYGGHEILEVSVHRDEGHFLKDGIAYYLTKNIIKKDDEYFIKSNPDLKEFDKKVNIQDFEKIYNYHAHVKFSMFDKQLGKTATMQKKDMSERIKFVSDDLGLLFAPEKETSRIKKNVNQVKNEHHAKATQKTKDNYNFREMQKKITSLENASVEDKKELHKLNSQVKNDKATIKELQSKISEYKNSNKSYVKAFREILPKAKSSDEVVEHVKTLKNELQDTKKVLNEELVPKELKTDSTQDMDALKAENKQLKNDIADDFEKSNNFAKEVLELEKVDTRKEYAGSSIIEFFVKKYHEMRAFIKDLITKNEDLEVENRELKEENTSLKIKIITLKSDIELGETSTLEDIANQLNVDEIIDTGLEKPEYKLNSIPKLRQ